MKNKNSLIGLSLLGVMTVAGVGVHLMNKNQVSSQPVYSENVFEEFKAAIDLKQPPRFVNESTGAPEFRWDKVQMNMWDEQTFTIIEEKIIDGWVQAWENQKSDDLLAVASDSFSMSRLPQLKEQMKHREVDSVVELKWPDKAEVLNQREAIKLNMRQYLSEFQDIVHFDLVTTGVRSNTKGMRNPADNTMQKAELEIRFDIRGVDQRNMRRNDRGLLLADVELVNGEWILNRIQFTSGETLVASRNPSFSDVTADLGLEDIKTYVRHEAIRRGGYAVSATDVDNDGHLDLYLGTMGQGQLLKGNSKGQFKVVENTGIQGDTLVKSAVFADFNNNGKQDLLLVRFEPSFKNGVRNDDVHFYENNGDGTFKLVDAIQHQNDMNFAMPAAVGDFNNNGLLDIYIGYPGAQDFTFLESMRTEDKGKQAQGLYFNQGENRFTDFTKNLAKTNPWESCCGLFPHSAMAVDHNLNGSMDIIVIDDAGKLSPFYVNKGDGTFHQSAKAVGAEMWDYGMSVAAGDLNNDGTMDLVYTSVNFHAAERMEKSFRMNFHHGQDYETFIDRAKKGVRLFKAHPTPQQGVKYMDFTEIAGLEFAGEGMAGVEFIDYDNNGLLDIYVANGLWTGTDKRKSQDISSLFIRSDKVLADAFTHLKALGEDYVNHRGEAESQSIIMKLLAEFRGDVMTANLDEQGPRPSFAGNQRNRLFRNNGDGTFTEVGFLEGVDSIADGYVIALADINKNGKMDLILRNGDPSSEDVVNRPVEVFLNNNASKRKSVTLTLEGTRTNRDAIGAFAVATIKDKQLTRQLLANNGSAQSQRILHFGLGDSQKIDKLQIHWPSGHKQILFDLPAGNHHIKESGISPADIVMK